MKHILSGFSLISAIALLALTLGCATTQQTEKQKREAAQQSYNPPVFPQ
jgi:hypothetical protein